jgi:selT/selW/selH-like putative selenoprotein
LGVEPKLVQGSTGAFDVAADGKVVFSRHREGRFPEEGEIIASVRPR